MALLDKDIVSASALVIDANPTSRSIIVAQLRDFGVGTVLQCARLSDARRMLEYRNFNIVVCEQYFAGEGATGRELLDELRQAQLLPHATVFVMITGEAAYDSVAEAAEAALDSYLLKPYSAAKLAERLQRARQRKRAMQDVFQAMEVSEFERAADLCLDRFRARSAYWLYSARIGAELLLRVGRHETARELYTAVIESKAVPWARLGVARAQAAAGQPASALCTLEALVAAEPGYADAYDVMGRVQIEQSRLDEALETYRRAAAITPNSIVRLQKLGMVAFYANAPEEAERVLDKAVSLGIGSRLYDQQATVLLAFIRFRTGNTKGLQRCIENLVHAASRDTDRPGLERFVRVAQALRLLLDKQLAAALEGVRGLAAERHQSNFDFEAACNLLSLLAVFATAELRVEGMETWVGDLSLRFSTARSATEMLSRAAAACPDFVQLIADGQARVLAWSEQAMSHALAGNPRAAVEALLESGELVLNPKLIDNARLTLQRYAASVAGSEALLERIEAIKNRLATPRPGDRGAGGAALRDGSPAAQTAARALAQVEVEQAADAAARATPPDTG